MATQGWLAPDWESTDWVVDDWLAALTSVPAVTAQLVGVQLPQYSGLGQPWVSYNWVTPDWVAGEWQAGGSWRANATGAVTGPTADWIIPALELAPVWTVRMGAGVDVRLVGVQLEQTGFFSAQFISVANDRALQLVATQAPQTMVMQATFTPSISLRDSRLAAQQAPQTGAFVATHVVSGGIPNRRYGRKQRS